MWETSPNSILVKRAVDGTNALPEMSPQNTGKKLQKTHVAVINQA